MAGQEKRRIGEQVYLRPITASEEDTANIIRWRNSDAVRPYFIYQKPFTPEGHQQWLEQEIFSGKGFQFIVCNREDDRPVGCTYLRDYDAHNRKAEYGMFLGEPMEKGKGIGKEIVALTLQFCFEELGLHKVFSRVFADNVPSIQSLIRCGFVQEAYLRDEEFVNGEYRDMVWMAVINPKEREEGHEKES